MNDGYGTHEIRVYIADKDVFMTDTENIIFHSRHANRHNNLDYIETALDLTDNNIPRRTAIVYSPGTRVMPDFVTVNGTGNSEKSPQKPKNKLWRFASAIFGCSESSTISQEEDKSPYERSKPPYERSYWPQAYGTDYPKILETRVLDFSEGYLPLVGRFNKSQSNGNRKVSTEIAAMVDSGALIDFYLSECPSERLNAYLKSIGGGKK